LVSSGNVCKHLTLTGTIWAHSNKGGKAVEKRILKALGSIGSAIALAILQIRASSDQRSLWLQIINDLSICFIQSMIKSPNRSKAWRGYIRWSDCL